MCLALRRRSRPGEGLAAWQPDLAASCSRAGGALIRHFYAIGHTAAHSALHLLVDRCCGQFRRWRQAGAFFPGALGRCGALRSHSRIDRWPCCR